MYIGPWQEFNLSKQRHPPSGPSTNPGLLSTSETETEKNKLIHRNLVSILENSLDPIAAQKAIQAINPYLQNVSDSSSSSSFHSNPPLQPPLQPRLQPPHAPKPPHKSRFPRVLPSDRRGKSYRHIKRSSEPTRHALPLILSARNSYDSNGPPSNRSIMSTNSEPIHGTVYTPDEKKNPPACRERAKLQSDSTNANTNAKKTNANTYVNTNVNTNANASSKSGYDPSNVLDILKIERNAGKSTVTSKHSDLSSFWKWKQEGKPLPATFTEGNKGNSNIGDKGSKKQKGGKINNEINKEERLNRLRQLYSQAESDIQDMSPTDSGGSRVQKSSLVKQNNHPGNLQLSPIRSPRVTRSTTYSKPCTPVVKDKELTDVDMEVVSKYFQKNHHDYSTLSQQRLSSQNLRSLSPMPSPQKRPPHEQLSGLMPHTPNFSRGASPNPSNREGMKNSNSSQGKSGACEEQSGHNLGNTNLFSDQGDVGYVAAEEGLLDWCTHLDVDDIDSMY